MEILLSTGIDIGTTTTHLIISKLMIRVKNSYGSAPKVEVAQKEIIYMSAIYYTPLEKDGKISAIGVKNIIEQEYKKAGITPAQLKSGAVIITGESARLRNAKELLYEISSYAGEFIVAEAGGETESILSGKGMGAADISQKEGKKVVSIDIGGGTSNIALFDDGKLQKTLCLNIGGRLLKGGAKEDKLDISYISPYAKPIIDKYQLTYNLNEMVSEKEVRNFCKCLVKELMTQMETLGEADLFLFSGGVAECIQNRNDNPFAYGDIGVILAQEIENSAWFAMHPCKVVQNPIRATVIGAGNYSVEVSGSTIACLNMSLPIQGIPCEKVFLTQKKEIDTAFINLKEQLQQYPIEKPIAVSFDGYRGISADDLMKIAVELKKQLSDRIEKKSPVIVLVREDIGKSLGICLRHLLPKKYPILCIDCVNTTDHDFIDIAEPVGGGRAVPVSIKQLVFSV